MKKVTAKNLMIGDWVIHGGKYKQVQGLPLSMFSGRRMIDVVGDETFLITATPIPITEEWLKGNGWEQQEHPFERTFLSKIGMVDVYYVIKDCFVDIHTLDGDSTYSNIQYIHQLQQAYRLATGGKELKVKF